MERNDVAVLERSGESELVGLTSAEVAREVERGNVNISREKVGRSTGRIIAENLLTFFNMVWAIVAVVLIAIESFTNLTFLFIIIPNVLIAIINEIRAKFIFAVEKIFEFKK